MAQLPFEVGVTTRAVHRRRVMRGPTRLPDVRGPCRASGRVVAGRLPRHAPAVGIELRYCSE